MKNVLICSNCSAENSFYSLNCKSCNAYLRSKIVNIDLWDTLWKLLESPVKTTENIICSIHKNFIITILTLAGIKVGITALVVFNAFGFLSGEITNSFNFILISAISFIILLASVTLIITSINNLLGIDNRFKDNFAIYTYSFLPIVITLIILSPIQLAIFGIYWFSFNPSPILFKPLTAYVMIFIEGLFYFWSMFLLITATYAQTKNTLYSIAVGLLETGILIIGVYLLTLLVY